MHNWENSFQIPKDIIECEANNPFAHLLIEYEDHQIVGYCLYTILIDRIEIENIEVAPFKRRKGIASMLLEKLDQLGIQNRLQNITLEVDETNVAAIALYEKMGFTTVAIRSHYYGQNDGLLMMKMFVVEKR